jgi:integrase
LLRGRRRVGSADETGTRLGLFSQRSRQAAPLRGISWISRAERRAGFVTVDEEGHSTHSPYALRHTYASWAIAAGIGLFELSRLMGTSVEQIDRTYGHLLPDSLDRARVARDAFAARDEERTANG